MTAAGIEGFDCGEDFRVQRGRAGGPTIFICPAGRDDLGISVDEEVFFSLERHFAQAINHYGPNLIPLADWLSALNSLQGRLQGASGPLTRWAAELAEVSASWSSVAHAVAIEGV